MRAAAPSDARGSAGARRLSALDGLRGLAALGVLTTHVAFHTGAVKAPVFGPIVSRLDVGVCLFFLLSGFLLYHPWARAAIAATPAPDSLS